MRPTWPTGLQVASRLPNAEHSRRCKQPSLNLAEAAQGHSRVTVGSQSGHSQAQNQFSKAPEVTLSRSACEDAGSAIHAL